MPNPWLPTSFEPTTERARVLCLPHAGGGSAVFHRWNREFGEADLIPINLPGRESRLDEPPIEDLRTLVQQMVPAVAEACVPPFAVFGYSMGALIAFEFVRQLRAAGSPLPDQLFVAACRAPQLPLDREPLHTLETEAMISRLVDAYGIGEQMTPAERSLMSLMGKTLKADLQIFETYQYVDEPPLEIPIRAIGGADDPQVSRAKLDAWRVQTLASFRSKLLPGHHFFLRTQQAAILNVLRAAFPDS